MKKYAAVLTLMLHRNYFLSLFVLRTAVPHVTDSEIDFVTPWRSWVLRKLANIGCQGFLEMFLCMNQHILIQFGKCVEKTLLI